MPILADVPQFAPFETWSGPGSGWKIDGSLVRFWATKAQATAGARAIGWPVSSVTQCATRFQLGWGLRFILMAAGVDVSEYDSGGAELFESLDEMIDAQEGP